MDLDGDDQNDDVFAIGKKVRIDIADMDYALNYAASIFGAVGTIILGYVAYKQNDRLQEMENNNYISNFSSTIMLKGISAELVNKKSTRIIPDEHCEQIIKEKNLQYNNPYVAYKFTCEVEIIGDVIPAFIHIRKCDISIYCYQRRC